MPLYPEHLIQGLGPTTPVPPDTHESTLKCAVSVKHILPFQRLGTVKHKLSIFLHLLHIQVS